MHTDHGETKRRPLRRLIGFQLCTLGCIILIRVEDDTWLTRILRYDAIEHNSGNVYSDCGANLCSRAVKSSFVSK